MNNKKLAFKLTSIILLLVVCFSSFTYALEDDDNLSVNNSYESVEENDENDEIVEINVKYNKNILASAGEAIKDIALSLLEEILVEALLPVADGFLYIISSCVGEVTTIDGIVFNNVEKLNINFWSGANGDAIRFSMSDVVRKWYDVFYRIAIIVYMMTLVVAGIQILLHSTADKVAQYKEYMVSWVVGVAILCLFPYAMKYVVMINETAVAAIGKSVGYSNSSSSKNSPAILSDYNAASEYFGTKDFVAQMGGASNGDTMLQTREVINENMRFALLVIYFILIGQMLALLMMYYKRVFMIAFLITIFPLVAMTYAIDKMGDKQAQSFGIWFKEFIVNVIVQIFHATVYAIIVGTGIQTYISSKGQNWLFMMISVLFLFQGEKILRSIFGIQSSANTMGDLATSGAVMYTAMKKLGGGGSNKNVGSDQDKKDMQGIVDRNKFRQQNSNAFSNMNNSNQKPSGAQASSDSSVNQNNSTFDQSAAMDMAAESGLKRKMRLGLASKAVKGIGQVYGTAAGLTYGAAQGDADGQMLKNMVGGAYVGKDLGEKVMAPATSVTNMAERGISGEIKSRLIKDGKYDSKLGLDGAMPVPGLPEDVDPNEVVGKNGETIQQIYREALAEMVKITSIAGRSAGEAAYWSYIDKKTKK